jgi:hypothetical protein
MRQGEKEDGLYLLFQDKEKHMIYKMTINVTSDKNALMKLLPPDTLFFRMRPKGLSPWCTVPLKSIAEYLTDSEMGEVWEIERIEMTPEEFDELSEFSGW